MGTCETNVASAINQAQAAQTTANGCYDDVSLADNVLTFTAPDGSISNISIPTSGTWENITSLSSIIKNKLTEDTQIKFGRISGYSSSSHTDAYESFIANGIGIILTSNPASSTQIKFIITGIVSYYTGKRYYGPACDIVLDFSASSPVIKEIHASANEYNVFNYFDVTEMTDFYIKY